MQTVPNASNPRGKMPAAVAASTLVLLALTIPLLFAFLFGIFMQPTASALPDVQPSPTATTPAVLTVIPETETTPTATVKSGTGGGGGGGGQANPTATPQVAPTATSAPPTPVPTVPIGSG